MSGPTELGARFDPSSGPRPDPDVQRDED